jgi:hypothetical protein
MSKFWSIALPILSTVAIIAVVGNSATLRKLALPETPRLP